MILTAHQPAYLPWLGYFEKIKRSEIFIFLDSVQYEKNSFTNRNKIRTKEGSIWLTVPVKTKGHTDSTLKDMEMDNRQHWMRKHLNAILLNYKKAPRFDLIYPKIKQLYENEFIYLADLCWYHLLFWLEELRIQTIIQRSSTMPIKSKKSDLIYDLCQYGRANHYISGALGKDYLDEEKFKQAGIYIEYQNYHHPFYLQWQGEFFPYMSIVDFVMNTEDYDLIWRNQNDFL